MPLLACKPEIPTIDTKTRPFLLAEAVSLYWVCLGCLQVAADCCYMAWDRCLWHLKDKSTSSLDLGCCYLKQIQFFRPSREASYCSETVQGSRCYKNYQRKRKEFGDKLSARSPESNRSGIGLGTLLGRIVAGARPEQGKKVSEAGQLSWPSMGLSQWYENVKHAASRQNDKSVPRANKSANADEVVRMMNLKQQIDLRKLKGKLSMQDAVYIVTSLQDKTLAFTFYQWVKRQPNYSPDKSFFVAVVECLMCDQSESSWDALDIVMKDMFRQRKCLDNSQFKRLLLSGRGHRERYNISRVSCFENWFRVMKGLGFVPDCSIYETLMKMCNRAGMHESTLSLFRDIRMNRYVWSYRLALSACRGIGNLELAQQLWEEMKLLGILQDAKCYTILLGFYGDRGDVEKAEKLLWEMRQIGVTADMHACTCVIHAYARVGMVKEGELLFQDISSYGGRLDAAIYRAMSACYRQAGLFKELLALLSKAKENGIQVGATCYYSAIQACTDRGLWEFAVDIFKHMQGVGLSPSPKLYCLMLHAYMMAKQHCLCEVLFLHMMKMKLFLPEAFELIIQLYKATERYSSAIDAFKLMKEHQCPPTSSIYEQIIPLMVKISLLEATELKHDMQCAGQSPSLGIYTSLIQEHIKQGDLVQSQKLYDEMLTAGWQPDQQITLFMVTKKQACEI